MTGDAGEISALVCAPFPSDVVGAVVTRQTDLARFSRPPSLDLRHVSACVVLDMRQAWPMTALAPASGRRRTWVLHRAVGCRFQRLALVGVALQALLGPNVAACRWRGGSLYGGRRLGRGL